MELYIAKNYQKMSELAADLVLKQVAKKKNSVLGLATGNTMLGLYKLMVKAQRAGKVSFKKVRTFNLDEFVGSNETDGQQSLFGYMRQNFFDKADLLPKNINFLDGRAKNLKRECAEYEQKIKTAGGIDLQLLGIGLDGHIGYAEPGMKANSRTTWVDLQRKSRKQQIGVFGKLSAVPKQGLTMGIATIMDAKKIVLLADGKEKAKVVARALEGQVGSEIPASFLQNHPNLTVILDKEAASKLKLGKTLTK